MGGWWLSLRNMLQRNLWSDRPFAAAAAASDFGIKAARFSAANTTTFALHMDRFPNTDKDKDKGKDKVLSAAAPSSSSSSSLFKLPPRLNRNPVLACRASPPNPQPSTPSPRSQTFSFLYSPMAL